LDHTGKVQGGQKVRHYFCNNFVYCQVPTNFTILARYTCSYTLQEISNWRIYSQSPNTFYVTTISCKILITILFMFSYITQTTFYFGNCRFLSNFHENNIIVKESDEYC